MKCDHDGCTCQVDNATFCSDYCEVQVGEASDGPMEHRCDCGHDDCQGTVI